MNAKRKIGFVSALCFVAVMCVAILLSPTVAQVNAASIGDISVSEFLSACTASGGSVASSDEGITYTPQGENSYLQIGGALKDYVYNSRWSVSSLSVRNTVALYMRNRSDATSASLQFITRSNRDYDSARSVSFALESGDGYKTYFVNLSSHPDCKGGLYGLRLVTNGSSGAIDLKNISFERERTDMTYAGEIISCTSDGIAVTVKGKLAERYAGKKISLYRTDISNITESAEGLEPIAETDADGNEFTFTVPYHDGEVSMLSSTFIAIVDGVNVSPMFEVENWRDFCTNPYEFDLPKLTVKVTDSPYNAKGDAYTDDTDSIQSAIDYVSAQGGGTVVLPGDDTWHGVRYMATTVWLKDNVELRIEKGAILLQNHREEDYRYPSGQAPIKGHDDPDNLGYDHPIWAHNGLTFNYPLIYAGGVDNVKITGGGAVRLADPGQNSISSMYTAGGYSQYCKSLIHLLPIGIFDCENVEVSDISILRTNGYHALVYACRNVYFGNVKFTEDNCVTGDGISIGLGTKNMIVDRCMFYTSDDTIVLCALTAAEPRGRVWWNIEASGGDNRLTDITVRHCAITPGNGVVFVAWGNDVPDLTMQAYHNLEFYDNILGVYDSSSSYCVNVHPTYGDPYGLSWKPLVTGHNIRFFGNSYRGIMPEHFSALIKDGSASDCDNAGGTTELKDASFEYNLAYWQYAGEYGAGVTAGSGVASISGKESAVYQAPTLSAGSHTFSAQIKTAGGASAKVFARDAFSGEVLASVSAGKSDYENVSVEFTLEVTAVVELGVQCESESGSVEFRSPAIASVAAENAYFEENYDERGTHFVSHGFERTREGDNGVLVMDNGGYGALNLAERYEGKSFALKFDFDFSEYNISRANGGGFSVTLRQTAAGYYRLSYDGIARKLTLEKVAVNSANRTKNVRSVLAECELSLMYERWYQLGLTADGADMAVYLDGEKLLEASDAQPFTGGSTDIRFTSVKASLDNLAVASADSVTFSRSPLWREGQGKDPYAAAEPEPTPDDTQPDTPPTQGKKKCGGCSSETDAVSAMGFAVVICAAAFLLSRRRKTI